jgi:2Fe-2S ferredoxin
MPYIILENLHSKAIDCKNKKEKLLDILLAETDWMHACGGKGKCTTCRAIVVDGMQSLGPVTLAEKRFLDRGKLRANERLTCQIHMGLEDLTIRIPDSSKLPHLKYSK